MNAILIQVNNVLSYNQAKYYLVTLLAKYKKGESVLNLRTLSNCEWNYLVPAGTLIVKQLKYSYWNRHYSVHLSYNPGRFIPSQKRVSNTWFGTFRKKWVWKKQSIELEFFYFSKFSTITRRVRENFLSYSRLRKSSNLEGREVETSQTYKLCFHLNSWRCFDRAQNINITYFSPIALYNTVSKYKIARGNVTADYLLYT